MILLFGLGNPGQKYEGTRHNVGFRWADKLAESLSATFKQGKGPYWVAEGRHKGRRVAVIKPTTFMNLSGKAVRKALAVYQTDLKNCLLCYDDLNLDAGSIRIRPGGSHGGHNGIKNIIEELNDKNFPRLRIGIGSDFPRGKQVDYVLSPFTKKESTEIENALDLAVGASFCFIREGVDIAMNNYN